MAYITVATAISESSELILSVNEVNPVNKDLCKRETLSYFASTQSASVFHPNAAGFGGAAAPWLK